MQEILAMLLQSVITIATPIVSAFAIRFLNERAAQAKAAANNERTAKHIAEVNSAVTTAVALVSQTFTDELKKSGTFSLENQRAAFNLAAGTARNLLTREASRFLTEAYGDASRFLAAKIEAEVKLQK